jgi:outer membrane protein assembly factor BamB
MVFTREELDRNRTSNIKRNRIILFVSLGVIVALLVFYILFQFTDVVRGFDKELESTPQGGDWVMFRYDSSRTGTVNPGNAQPKGEISWTFETEDGIHSSPAVVNGAVYFGSRDGNVYALKADTGEKLWSFKTGSWVESSPIVVGGIVYIGSNDGKFYALDAKTGQERWSFKTDYSVRSTAAAADGVVYFGADDYCVYALDAATGGLVWKYETGTQVTSSPVIADGVVVVGSAEGLCFTLNAKTGKPRLQFETHSNVASSPAVNNGVAYITDSSGNLYALDIHARNWFLENKLMVYWKTLYIYNTAPKPPAPSGYIWRYNMGRSAKLTSSTAFYDNKVYLGAGNSLLSIDVNTWKQVWAFATRDIVSSSPTVTDKALYVGSQDGRFYAVDRATGSKLWDIATGGQVTSSPALANGVLYFGSHDGKFYAVK